MPTVLILIFAALLGLCVGSFSNVLIYRDESRRTIATGRSACPHCAHLLSPLDLIPVLSYVWLGGKCRYCHKAISSQYPLVELLVMLLSVYAFWYGLLQRGSVVLALGLLASLICFVVMSAVDIRTMMVSLDYCILAGLLGGGARVLSGDLSLSSAGFGLLAGAGILGVIMVTWKLVTHRDGMGSGDIWIAGAVGALVGWPAVVVGLAAAVLIGAVVGIGVAARQKSLQLALPFGPFLALGAVIALQWGDTIARWYILGL